MGAGEKLRHFRKRLGITTRQVEEFSRIIAHDRQNEEFHISNAWLTQLEKQNSIPGIYKLYTLSVIYRMPVGELLKLFEIDLSDCALHGLHDGGQQSMAHQFPLVSALPVSHSDCVQTSALDATNPMEKIVSLFGDLPWPMLQLLELRTGQYAFIGMKDYTMYPLIRPGSFVQIESSVARRKTSQWHKDLDRPIYFIELRGKYICSWCDVRNAQLTVIPHPLSGCPVEQFAFPADAEILGQVVGVAMRLAPSSSSRPEMPSTHTLSDVS